MPKQVLCQANYTRYGPGPIHVADGPFRDILYGSVWLPACNDRSKKRAFNHWRANTTEVTCKLCIKKFELEINWRCSTCGVKNHPDNAECVNCHSQLEDN